MTISVFDLFKVGIGPSSSHTVGPMLAANRFIARLQSSGRLPAVYRVQVQLYGSLGATGKGHGSDRAVLLGLLGELPDRIDPQGIDDQLSQVRAQASILLYGKHRITFDEKKDLLLHKRKTLPYHPNGIRIDATDSHGALVESGVFYSVGGGFVVDESAVAGEVPLVEDSVSLPRPFRSAVQLLEQAHRHGCPISDVMLANELVWRSEQQVNEGLLHIWAVMQQCVINGCNTDGILPGGLKVKRRASELYRQLSGKPEEALKDPR